MFTFVPTFGNFGLFWSESFQGYLHRNNGPLQSKRFGRFSSKVSFSSVKWNRFLFCLESKGGSARPISKTTGFHGRDAPGKTAFSAKFVPSPSKLQWIRQHVVTGQKKKQKSSNGFRFPTKIMITVLLFTYCHYHFPQELFGESQNWNTHTHTHLFF